LPTLKGNWDKIVSPPEELGKFISVLKKIFFFIVVIPSFLCILSFAINYIFLGSEDVYLYSGVIFALALFVSIPLLFIIFYAGSKKVPSVVKLEMKWKDIRILRKKVGRWLEENGYPNSFGLPDRSSHKKYLMSKDDTIFIKHELFLAVYKWHHPGNKTIIWLEIYYLPSVWEEALILQKDLDEFLFEKGLSVPLEKDSKLTFF